MKIGLWAAILGASVSTGTAATPWAEAHGGTLKRAPQTVYVTLDRMTGTYAAKKIAGSIFKQAGVTIVWRTPGPAADGAAPIWLRVELADQTPAERLPGALAASYPFDGCAKGITVFYDRIRSLARSDGHDPLPLQYLHESGLLGYVLVHEITHVLEGTDHHSETGVMKARWDGKDRASIFEGRLGFRDEDLVLIQRGMANGSCQATARLIARSRSGIEIHPD